jgi:hypothetical protein
MKTISQSDWELKTGFSRRVPTLDYFTLSSTWEAENTSSSLPKPLDISGQLFSSIPSQYLETNRTSRLPLSIISAKSRQQTHIETRMIMQVGLEYVDSDRSQCTRTVRLTSDYDK